ncbi:hypothetical protein HRF87_00815 [Bacillus sp. CRN 9]|nr:hypothetical protein [Bacillus sp. CRN 9]
MSNTVTQEQVNKIFTESTKEVFTSFDKCTVMVCQLPNGFTIVESSACVDLRNYDYAVGAKICEERIKDKIWELEGYKLHDCLNKKVLKFEEVPKLVFISKDGKGNNDELYVNGEKVTGEKEVKIYSVMEGFTEHEVSYLTSQVKE